MNKRFWLGLSLVNLSLVALLGFLLRSKMLFSLPFIDYRNLLSAHSYYAFGGWVGLSLITFLVFDLLPENKRQKKIYMVILACIQFSSAGMGFSYAFFGTTSLSGFFSVIYVLTAVSFGGVFLNDLRTSSQPPLVRWLAFGSVASLLLSCACFLGLLSILWVKSGNTLLYRDLLYAFLHLQYNGFFTLAIFALYFSQYQSNGFHQPEGAGWFVIVLLSAVLPSLALSLLWHNTVVYYGLAVLGACLTLLSAGFFLPVFRLGIQDKKEQHPLARLFFTAAFVSFFIKMLLTVGTLYTPLGNAVYGARPVIIGFLHLVFLAFVSFYVLGRYVEQAFFTRNNKVPVFPFYLFASGVLLTEALLLSQGLQILFQHNSALYYPLLWMAALLLLAGAVWMARAFFAASSAEKRL